MAGPATPAPHRRPLPPSALATALRASAPKPILLTDTTSTTSTSRRAPPPSASTARVSSIAWSPLGTHLAVADTKSVRVWNPEKPGVRHSTELRLPSSSAASTSSSTAPVGGVRRPPPPTAQQQLQGTEKVCWRPTREAELATVGADGFVRFFDVRAKGTCVGEVKVGGEGYAMAWHPSGEQIVVCRRDDVLIPISLPSMSGIIDGSSSSAAFGTGAGTGIATPEYSISAHHPLPPHQTNAITFSHSGSELITCTSSSTVNIYDYPTLAPLETLHPNTSSITTLALSPAGRHLAFGGSDALITLYETAGLTCKFAFSGMSGSVRSVGFSWDGSYLAGGCLGDEPSGPTAVGGPTSGASTPYGAGAAPGGAGGIGGAPGGVGNGNGAAATAEGSGIKIFHVESGEEVFEIPTGNTPAPVVEWHPSRYLVAWGGEGGSGVRVVGMGAL